jgi:eukaryotic-like serine/threonine-protein kinase
MQETQLSPSEEIPPQIGPYPILRTIGRGGMGEVYLAQDPLCGREIAVKRIRPDLSKNQTIAKRFLREAHIAGQLTHPGIVPILSIQNTPPEIYYTMPYVGGETLKQILRGAQDEPHPIARSIPSLARIFLQICEAISYTHSKGILHRDLKPENILIGPFGEVMILDWGIADYLTETTQNVRHPEKVAGTLAYMAPERLSGIVSVQADLYALGVILYYMLTLQLPFQRKNVSTFRKQKKHEKLIDPLELSPYRDIPLQLSEICKRCLAYDPQHRFQSVNELIVELKKYHEGHAQWIPIASLHPNRKEDWQFQEHILPAKHLAITRNLAETEWVAIMISRKNFSCNMRLEMRARLLPGSHGIGFLISIPSVEERKMLEEGYCLFLSHSECRLYRNNIQVLFRESVGLSHDLWHALRMEKVEDVLKLYIDHRLIFTYVSHLPLSGACVGLLHKDGLFELEEIQVFDASHNAYVRCLTVPNAFLSHKLYDLALSEYRRIGQSFPGRQEGREALFRAGITLLEKGKAQRSKTIKEQCYHRALKEFGALYRTSGAPLEYLGKSLVYDALGDPEEEAKCLELALRKFPNHPLSSILQEHVLYRMHESSRNGREAAYRIILVALRHLSHFLENSESKELLSNLQSNLEPLAFLEQGSNSRLTLAISLAFWLAKPLILEEIAHSLSDPLLIENALFCLLELEAISVLDRNLALPIADSSRAYFQALLSGKVPALPKKITRKEARLFSHLLKKALIARKTSAAIQLIKTAHQSSWESEDRAVFDSLVAWHHCLREDWKSAQALLDLYADERTKEQSPFHFCYGCILYATQGSEAAHAHFSTVLDTPFPPITALPSHFLLGRINGKKGWIEKAFWWEKKELHRQLDFFYHSLGLNKKT